MPLSLLSTHVTYVRGILYFVRTGGDFVGCPFLQSDAELPIKVRSIYPDVNLNDATDDRAVSTSGGD